MMAGRAKHLALVMTSDVLRQRCEAALVVIEARITENQTLADLRKAFD